MTDYDKKKAKGPKISLNKTLNFVPTVDVPEQFENGKAFLPTWELAEGPCQLKRWHEWYIKASIIKGLSSVTVAVSAKVFMSGPCLLQVSFTDMHALDHRQRPDTNLIIAPIILDDIQLLVSKTNIKLRRNLRWKSFRKQDKDRLKSESAVIVIGYDRDRQSPSWTRDMFGQKSAAKTCDQYAFGTPSGTELQQHSLMAEKPPPSPSSADKSEVPPKTKTPKPSGSEVHEGNIVPVTVDKLSPEQKKEFELMMQQAHHQFLNSFMLTRKGTVVQKYKVLLRMEKDNKFRLPSASNVPPAQPTAPVSAPAPAAPTSAPTQLTNPRLLTREQPQHAGRNVNRLAQEQVVAMFLPNQPTVDPVQQLSIQQTPPRQQITQPIQQQSLLNASARFRTPDNQPWQHVTTQVVPEHLVHNVQPDQSVIPQVIPEHLRFAEAKKSFKKINHVYPYIYDSDDEDDSEVVAAEWVRSKKVVPCPWRFAEAKKSFKKINHVYPYIYDSDDEDDSEVVAAEWVRSKKVVPCPWVRSSGKEERFNFDITKADKIFDLLLREKQIQLPAGHIIPSAEELGKRRYCKWHNSGSHSTNDCKVFRQRIQAAIEGGKIKFDDSKKPMKVDGNPFPVNMVHTFGRAGDGGKDRNFQMNSARIISKYRRKYDKQQQERYYEEDDGGFDPHWECEFFRFCWNEGMRLPSIEDRPGCSNVAESSSRSYNRSIQLRQTRVPVHQRLGPVNQECDQRDDEDRKTQWCPSGIFTKNQKRRVQRLRNREHFDEVNQKRRVQRLRNREHFDEVEQEINHRPRQEWHVKNQAAIADEVKADEAKRLAKGKSVVTASVNMVFTLPTDFGAKQANVDEVEEASARLVLSPEQAIFEKPEGTENRHLNLLYINSYVNGKLMTKMMVDGGVAPGVRPYHQPPRRCKADMLEPIKAKVKCLYDARFIHPCRYAEWVSNIVPVIKKNGKVRVCIDFRDLNKATLKDEHPMPVADQLVDAASGHKILSFMDSNDGYNQIFMEEEDIHKTAFRCPGAIGLFEWVVMTFVLKSARATYQRAMNYIYHVLIGCLVEVYIDDVVVKSKEIEDHIADLRKFLGFLVHERGFEITQRSVNAIKKIQPPENKIELSRERYHNTTFAAEKNPRERREYGRTDTKEEPDKTIGIAG
uniref:Reverse transcriptase domain-containing protein n=1 Tax=Oryza meridionalis TaxID=40149 RepID=A0A0E0DBG7_9ORYZ